MKPAEDSKEPEVIDTPNGYRFYRRSDGSYADSLDPEQVDMVYVDYQQIVRAIWEDGKERV